jgi:glycosyltransferase involved in cell wall biosynthesis
MAKKKQKVTAIFLGYNAAKTLKEFYTNFPKKYFDEIILVDDASKDKTFEIAKKLGIRSYKNSKNLGYGGNMKRAFKIALEHNSDVIVDIHPDGEYKPSAIPEALMQVEKGSKMILGNRFSSFTKPMESGMYIWKYFPIRFLNFIDQIILGVKLDDFHQGFRVYTKDLLTKVNYLENSNDYLFSFEIIVQAVFHKFKITQVLVETNYTGKKRGASFKNSIKYSLGTFKILGVFILAKLGIKHRLFSKEL